MRLLRGRKALILSMMLGLIAAILSYQYIQQMAALPPPSVEMSQVVVAAVDIPSRAKLTTAMLKQEEIPLSAKHPDAVTSLKEAEGKITRLPITAGEQLLFKKFAVERSESGLAFLVPPSKRAVSIKVSEVTGSGGLIVPGDHVDVIGVFDAKTMGEDMAVFVLQDIEVLAVGQILEGVEDESTIPEKVIGSLGTDGQQKAKPIASKPKAQPEAKSVTLAVDPEQAQRLVLAEERGKLRLALRPYKDSGIADLGEAKLGAISGPLKQAQARITAVSISPTQLKVGETMKIEVTVKNTSAAEIKSQGPGPGFTYVQGQTFRSQNFPSQYGAFRVGINLAGQAAVEFPYRWGFGANLPPGSSVTVVGYIKFTNNFELTNFWAGLIMEPAEVVDDNVGMTQVSVIQVSAGVVVAGAALIRSEPSMSSSIIESIPLGAELTILGKEADWYKVEIPRSGKQGYVAASSIAPSR